jgi:hypothetical protein
MAAEMKLYILDTTHTKPLAMASEIPQILQYRILSIEAICLM